MELVIIEAWLGEKIACAAALDLQRFELSLRVIRSFVPFDPYY